MTTMTQTDYETFLASKRQTVALHGKEVSGIHPMLYPFQAKLVEWACRKRRAAIFADCGLGKTPMQLIWADTVLRQTNKPVLILTPLAVSPQTVREADKFGIEAHRSPDGQNVKGIVVANYERLHYFNAADFAGVVCDESSILKSFDGTRRTQITEFMRQVPYRLLCTATAAPNDYIELGTSSEALGELGHTDMLGRFFTNKEHTVKGRAGRFGDRDAWHFKGHGELPFWQWVSSWSRAIRKPSDFGFDDGPFILPPLQERKTIVRANMPRKGMLFDVPAIGLQEEREVRRRTLTERCEAAAAKVTDTGQPAVVWCHLNDEGDTLSKMIPDSLQVSGQDSDEAKEEKFEAFRTGQLRVLVIKPKIGAFGLNWQHCAHVVYFPSDSYEQYYQAVRRCWRFGQTRPVVVDQIITDSQERMLSNLLRKAQAADAMFSTLLAHMNEALSIDSSRKFTKGLEVPKWL